MKTPTRGSLERSGPDERVGGVGRVGVRPGEEPLGVLDHPPGVDARVVGHHVAREADAPAPRPVAQVGERRVAAEAAGHRVVGQRVGGGLGLGVAHPPLDVPRGGAALPHADQPERGEPAPGERVQLLVGDLVEPPDGPAVRAGELVEPDQGVLRDHHHPGHPVPVGAEGLGFRPGLVVGRHARDGGARRRGAEPLLLAQEVEAGEQPGQQVAEQRAELAPDVLELVPQRIRGMRPRGCAAA